MLVFLTHRRLKPGTFDQLPKAWEPAEMAEGIREVANHARSTEHADEIIWFGLDQLFPEAHELWARESAGVTNEADRWRLERSEQ